MLEAGHTAATSDTVLILIPDAGNAGGAEALLSRNGITCRLCSDMHDLAEAVGPDAGAVLIADEVLWQHGLDHIGRRLAEQPQWSDLPFIVLTRGDTSTRRTLLELHLPDRLGNVVFLEMPLSSLSLVSAVRSALRARRRQRQVGANLLEQRAAAAALRESEARFRHMADSAPALIWMTDAKGDVTFMNMHHGHTFGHRVGDLLRYGWGALVLEEDRAAFEEAFSTAFSARTPFAAEIRICDRENRIRWLRCEGVPRLDDEGRFLGYTSCCLDSTERRLATAELERRVEERTAELSKALAQLNAEVAERERAEAALRQAQKMEAIGQLTGGIAHDFNNMLQAIAGCLELIEKYIGQQRAARAAPYVAAARQAVERAARLTHRLLAFARRQTLQPMPIEPNRLVREMEEMIQRTVGPSIQLEMDLADGTWCVLCDQSQLEAALLNLCINARDAMPDGGTLTVRTADRELDWRDLTGQDEARPGRYVEISVRDNGTGMPPDILVRAFEPFFTTKPFGQGTGLGLSQLYGFLRQSGGFVRLESQIGLGTTVRLFLPWCADRPERNDLTVEADATDEYPVIASGMPQPTVLVVEDETAIRRLIADALREMNCAVLEAEDGPAGLQVVRSGRRIDLLLTDVGLPGLNGRQLADAARETRPDLPVLLITGFPGTALADMKAIGMDVMRKPFALDALLGRVRTLLSPALAPRA
ncbi:MAG: response regulator [Proteobacteria bacterium]|nr:response regulator [Pseudomonadota bacterium]